jgi:hypothetical protein
MRMLARRMISGGPENRSMVHARRRAPDRMGTVPGHIKLIDVAGSSSLLFRCGGLPADGAVLAAGHEPNGYFWGRGSPVSRGRTAHESDLDLEAGMFCVRGDRVVLGQLREELAEYLDDPERTARLIR